EIVERFHDRSVSELAAQEFVARFQQGAIPEDIPEFKLSVGVEGLRIPHALKQAGLCASTSEAMRAIEQGGVRIDGEKISDKALKLHVGMTAILQVGKRKFARIFVVAD